MKGPRLDDRDEVPVTIIDADLVEALLAEVHEAEFETVIGHRARMPREVRLHESDGRRVEFAVMDADAQHAVADDSIFVRVDVGGFELGKTERLVPEQGFDDVLRTDADFEEVADAAQRSAPMARARSRDLSRSRAASLSLQSGDDSGQPPECLSTRRARKATWSSRAFSAGI